MSTSQETNIGEPLELPESITRLRQAVQDMGLVADLLKEAEGNQLLPDRQGNA